MENFTEKFHLEKNEGHHLFEGVEKCADTGQEDKNKDLSSELIEELEALEVTDFYDEADHISVLNKISGILLDSNSDIFKKNALLMGVFKNFIERKEMEEYKPIEILRSFLSEYIAKEQNFFLKNLMETFLNGKIPEASVDEKRNAISGIWNDSIENTDNKTVFYAEVSNYNFGRIVDSADKLTDEEVGDIYDMLQYEDSLHFSAESMYEFAAANRYKDKNLENQCIDQNMIPPIDFMNYGDEKYIGNKFFAKIDQRTGGVYENGELKKIFKLNRSGDKHEKLGGLNLLRKISSVLGHLNKFIATGYDLNIDSDSLEYLLNAFPNGLRQDIEDIYKECANTKIESNFNKYDIDETYLNKIRDRVYGFLQDNASEAAIIEEISPDDYPGGLFKEKEQKEELVNLYKAMMSARMRLFLEDYFNINLSDFYLNTQAQFLNFISDKPEEYILSVRDFINKGNDDNSKKERLATFLSLDYGQEFGDKILLIGEKLPWESAQSIFQKYSELADASEKVSEYIKDTFGENKECKPELVNAIREALLKKSKDLLVNFADEIEVKDKESISNKEIIEKLKNIKTDTLLFLYSFKTMKRSGTYFNIENIKDLGFASENALEISESDKKRMGEIYNLNYIKYPELRNFLAEKFKDSAYNENNIFHILRHKDEIRGFYRIEERGKDDLYFGAFNIDQEYKGSALGEAMLEQSLDYYGKSELYTIEADSAQSEPITSNYIERGFIAVKQYQLKEIGVLNIFWNEEMNHLLFKSKRFSNKEIIQMAKIGENTECYNGNIIVSAQPVSEISALSFDMINKKEADKQYVATRYLREKNPEGENIAYIVFEKISEEHLKMYQSHTHPDLEEDFPASPKEGEDYFMI